MRLRPVKVDIWLKFSALTAALFIFCLPCFAFAVSCSTTMQADCWFRPGFNYNATHKEPLPDAIHILDDWPESEPSESGLIRNFSPTPLYMPKPDKDFVFANDKAFAYFKAYLGLPPNWPKGVKPVHMIMQNKVYRYTPGEAFYYYFLKQPDFESERLKKYAETYIGYWQEVKEPVLLSNYFPVKNTCRDHRPISAKPPAPEPMVIEAFYGDQPLRIHADVTYTLNPDYNPTAGITSLEQAIGCRE